MRCHSAARRAHIDGLRRAGVGDRRIGLCGDGNGRRALVLCPLQTVTGFVSAALSATNVGMDRIRPTQTGRTAVGLGYERPVIRQRQSPDHRKRCIEMYRSSDTDCLRRTGVAMAWNS